jgi:hypothetical protein
MWKFIIKEDGGMHKRCHFLIREATKKHFEKNKIKMNHVISPFPLLLMALPTQKLELRRLFKIWFTYYIVCQY